jgi:hypothetical protein
MEMETARRAPSGQNDSSGRIGAGGIEAASFPDASVVSNRATVPKPIAEAGVLFKKSRRFTVFLLKEDAVDQ